MALMNKLDYLNIKYSFFFLSKRETLIVTKLDVDLLVDVVL